MKKIILALDGNHLSEGAFKFVTQLNKYEPVLLTGVFLPVVDYAELLYSLGGLGGPLYFQDAELEDTRNIQKNIDRFKDLCLEYGLEYRVHPDLDRHVISEIKQESRYADLLVIASELFYENLGDDSHEQYVENALHKSECPVVLIPEHYHAPDNITLAYDGSESSVYAIKQFAYLFPEFKHLKTLLVYAGTKDIPGIAEIEELAARHFVNLTVCKLEIDPKKYFNTWLEDNGNTMLVSGAYSRSALSEVLSSSFISKTIRDHKVPIFVAHK